MDRLDSTIVYTGVTALLFAFLLAIIQVAWPGGVPLAGRARVFGYEMTAYRRRNRDLWGLLLVGLALLFYVADFGSNILGSVGDAFGRLWYPARYVGGTLEFRPSIVLAWATIALVLLRAFALVVARRYPDKINVYSRSATAVAGICLAVAVGFGVSAVFELNLWQTLVLYALIAGIYFVLKSQFISDLFRLSWQRLILLWRFLLQGIAPLLARLVYVFWRLARMITQVPRILEGPLRRAEERVRNPDTQPSRAAQKAEQLLEEAEETERRDNR